MRRVLVTGAAGYVGGVVVRRLLAEPATEVVGIDACAMPHGADGLREILDHPRLTLHRVDVRDTDALAPHVAGADAVVHLAAIVGDPAGRRDPDLTREVNLHASERLLDVCARAGADHLIFVSTCSNYGFAVPDELVDEDAPLNPLSLYAETKVAVERLLAERDDVRSTRLRFATVYGTAPRMRFDLTVNQFAIEAVRDRRLVIYGADHWRPYLHVEDAADAVARCLEQPERSVGRVFNVGDSSEHYTKRMLFDLLAQRVPRLEVEWVGRTEDPRSYRVDFSRIGRDLGFAPRWRVPEGIDQVLRHAALGAFPEPAAARFRN
jgi:nucleoside-diphosphate-sugar epimerase